MSESASRSSALPRPENLRPKQIQVIEAFNDGVRTVVAKLPTGYGKTLAAAGAFAKSYYDGRCNRILAVVPRRNQAKQLAEELPNDLLLFGIKTKAIIVGDDPYRAYKSHAKGLVIVFVVTIQSLLGERAWAAVSELMETGSWFGFIDEHHHYNADDDGGWTNKIRNLNFVCLLAMSATPNRHDGSDHFPDPTISEKYIDAAETGYVKKLSLNAYHYAIDAVTKDGQVVKMTTEELVEQAGQTPEAIDAFMAERKMRFSPKYISPLIFFPIVQRLVDLRSRGIRSQALVQAMSCRHAECVAEQIRSILPEHLSVDWIGTGPAGRPEEQNEEVIKRFCPKKNKLTGTRPWSLDVLVNVGMAGEGMDSIDVTEVIFLTPANITMSNLQTIGRESRPMKLKPGVPQPVGTVNVDTSSPMASYIGRDVMKLFDETTEIKERSELERGEPDLPDYEPLPEKLAWVLVDMHLLGIRSEPMFQEIFSQARSKTDTLAKTDEEISAIVEKAINEYLNRTNDQTAINAQLADQVDSAVSKIAGLIIRRMSTNGLRIERTLPGDLRRRINTKKKIIFGAVSGADEPALKQHWQWLRDLEKSILSNDGLAGVPQWLR